MTEATSVHPRGSHTSENAMLDRILRVSDQKWELIPLEMSREKRAEP